MKKESRENRRRFLALGAGVAALTSCKSPALSKSGAPMRPYGERSSHESSSSRTPLQDLYGIITPSSLHFERHHSGVPNIDPHKHELLLHGLVDRPLTFTMADIRRFPSVSRICFLECSGNSVGGPSGSELPDVQQSHGLLSCSEWTGVPLSVLLREAGAQPALP